MGEQNIFYDDGKRDYESRKTVDFSIFAFGSLKYSQSYSPRQSTSLTRNLDWAGIRNRIADSWKPCVMIATAMATATIIQPKPLSG